MARAKQPVSVGGIEFDALIDAEESYEAQVPEYPTEKGYSVSDNVALKPEILSMTLYVTDTPVTWLSRHGSGQGRTESVVKKLKELYFARQPVEVITSDEVYTDMAITSLSIRKSLDVGYAREIPISLKKVVVTEAATVTIPDSYGKSGTTGASGGTASTKTATNSATTNPAGTAAPASTGGSSTGKGSVLHTAAKSFGLL